MTHQTAGRPVVVVIGGSDPIGAAGIQADLRHLAAWGVHGAAVPTALTVQTVATVDAIHPVAPDHVRAMLEAVSATFEPDAVLVGMLANEPVAREVLLWLHKYHGRVVLDPVIHASAGRALIDDDAIEVVRDFLLPRSDLTLPNTSELAILAGGDEARDEAGRIRHLEELIGRGAPAVLSKGGHGDGPGPVDLLHDGGTIHRWSAARHAGSFRGAGGALAASCAALLARGVDLHATVTRAHGALQRAFARAAAAKTPFLHFDPADTAA